MGNRFPLFNRIVVFILCVLVLVGITWRVVSPKAGAELNVVTGLLAVVFGGMACWALWLTLTWRERPSTALDELDAVDLPPLSVAAIEYRYFTGTKSGTVVIDPQSETIYFLNCHVPRRFLAVAEREYSCPMRNIRAIHRFVDRSIEWLTVVTDAGKAVVPNTGADFEELWRVLRDFVPENAPGFATDDPRMGFVWVLGAIGGLFGGWYLTPDRAGETTLSLFLLCGAILGVVSGHLLIWIIDRWFRVNVARTIGYGTIGAIAGFGIGSSQMLAAGWPAQRMIWTALGGFLLGAAVSRSGAFGKR